MHVQVSEQDGRVVLEGDGAFFTWLSMAANGAANGFQGNQAPMSDGRMLELVTTEPKDQQPKGRRMRPAATLADAIKAPADAASATAAARGKA